MGLLAMLDTLRRILRRPPVELDERDRGNLGEVIQYPPPPGRIILGDDPCDPTMPPQKKEFRP